MITEIILDNLISALLSLIVAIQISAFSLTWRKIRKTEERLTDEVDSAEEEASKNSETLSMLLNRIFGLDKDPTDKGHIMETEDRFQSLENKLEEIAERQREACVERKREHEMVDEKISTIVRVLQEKENIDIEREV